MSRYLYVCPNKFIEIIIQNVLNNITLADNLDRNGASSVILSTRDI